MISVVGGRKKATHNNKAGGGSSRPLVCPGNWAGKELRPVIITAGRRGPWCNMISMQILIDKVRR